MNTNHIVKMANQIANFYETYPDLDQARQEVANHLTRFWDLRMRSQVIEHVTQHQGEGLSSLAIEAIRKLMV